ncbi:protein boule-like isoform X1 [Oncorhynchus kisutch]|uniref:protein boule-like isoform X1 n=1 Tax=Oncorhynchus kisutch TaxID=8019 RepID=UPI0012DD722A|nr:protein boule-like isoform X1 [Oncorhynchus kisutch]XP_031669471.1 protein boule-like isoform X1 [Oncorhynchus kisutch]XP_031673589.1 protein boule-like isoform X1 [Oncorhynchus kisutch]
MENEITLISICTQTSTPSPPPAPVSQDPSNDTSPSHHAPRFGTIIPNRIFVGGIDFKTNESDLRRFFSQHGAVKEVKIVIDRAGVSKGYGFVTFETQEDTERILHDADRLCFRDKRLNIGQAVRKQQVGGHPNSFSVSSHTPAMIPTPCGTMYLTTPTGYPYTYHNGVAYFHTPEMSPSTPYHWPSRSVPGSPVMLTHQPPPIYQQPAYHHYQAPTQCHPSHLQWNVPQSPVPSSPVLYMQPSELLYQPMEQPSDGGCVQPAMPLIEAPIPEQQFIDHMVQPAYNHTLSYYPQSPGGMTPVMIQQEPGKEQKFHATRRGYPSSPASLKPRYGRNPHYAHLRKEYRPEITTDPSPPPATEPLK